MNRRWVWINLVLGCVLLQTIRVVAGYQFDASLVIEAAYWSGAGLGWHWFSTAEWFNEDRNNA